MSYFLIFLLSQLIIPYQIDNSQNEPCEKNNNKKYTLKNIPNDAHLGKLIKNINFLFLNKKINNMIFLKKKLTTFTPIMENLQ
jgi:hypothetical protein